MPFGAHSALTRAKKFGQTSKTLGPALREEITPADRRPNRPDGHVRVGPWPAGRWRCRVPQEEILVAHFPRALSLGIALPSTGLPWGKCQAHARSTQGQQPHSRRAPNSGCPTVCPSPVCSLGTHGECGFPGMALGEIPPRASAGKTFNAPPGPQTVQRVLNVPFHR